MKQILLFLLILTSTTLFAQPANDDCDGLIDLGVVPFCETDVWYTNVDATESMIGNDNIPPCFNGGYTGQDVWFMFTASDTIINYQITVTGTADPTGSIPVTNPQVAVYRGDCSFDNLALFDCGSATLDDNEVQIDVLDMDPGEVYFLRINNYSGSASELWGSFQLCIEELPAECNLGPACTGSTACAGTVYDSGGPDGDYMNNENFTFTICPNDFHECIYLNLVDYGLETNFDNLTVFSGDDTGAPVLTNITGTSSGNNFSIQASTPCVTLQFTSDGSATDAGFELTWQCTSAPCNGSSTDNPTVIDDVPFTGTGLTTCDDAVNFGATPCVNDGFILGPEVVYSYTPTDDICISVSVENAEAGAGVLIIDGDPLDPATNCIAQGPSGLIGSVSLEAGTTYYIVVADGNGCTDFDLIIEEADCLLSPALVDALCNPLNGCAETSPDGELLPSVFFFQDGFQDIALNAGQNDGCWINVGSEADFYWFTIEAQADGPFGFILESADIPSDIDINVWGPFSQTEVCDEPSDVIDFIETNQPIRSTWAGGADPTGLADIHPVLGTPVTDPYDCDPIPGAGGDDFCSTIPALEGEVYVVLVNDWGNQIQSGGIQVDWLPSEPEVLEPVGIAVLGADTTICAGETVQIEIQTGVNEITWLNDLDQLSCTDCLDPIISPTETNSYYAAIDGVCVSDTIKVDVMVFGVDAGPDFTVCTGEDVQIVAGSNFSNATYEWNGPNLSCTDCADPVISTMNPGTFVYTVTLFAPTCTLQDQMTLVVDPSPAPVYQVSDDITLCIGESLDLGDPSNDSGMTYSWTSTNGTFSSSSENPNATPNESGTYYVEVTNALCPTPSFDSVMVEVSSLAILDVANDTTVCQGELVQWGNTIEDPNVTYTWSPIDTTLNPIIVAEAGTNTYTLTANSGACTQVETITIESINIAVDITLADSTTICQDEVINLSTTSSPVGADVTWVPDMWISSTTGNDVSVTPQSEITYYATVSVPGCMVSDSIYVSVDSIPTDLPIMPLDTSVCKGQILVLQSLVYEENDYTNINIQWTPEVGFISPDSLLNLVIEADATTTYQRIMTNGACTQVDTALVQIIETAEIAISPLDPTICSGESLQLEATSADITEFTWTTETNISCTDCPNPTVDPTSTTTYTVEGEFEDCPVSESVTIEVIPGPNYAVISNEDICVGESIVLNSINDPNSTYSWTSEPAGFTSSQSQPEVNPSETTTYTLSISNAACGPFEENVTIEVIAAGALTVSEDIVICPGDETVLTANSTTTGTYDWSPNLPNGEQVTVSPSVTTTYNVVFENICETLEGMVLVTVAEGVNVDNVDAIVTATQLPPDPMVQQGTGITLTVLTDPAAPTGTTYEWFQNGESVGTGATFNVNPLDFPTSTYTVIATTADGCTDEGNFSINVEEAQEQIPNVFTPDGDGSNDIFNILIAGNIEVMSFKVFDRWGELVFEDDDNSIGWNGRKNDKPMPSDVYVYMITIQNPDGSTEILKGDITLLR